MQINWYPGHMAKAKRLLQDQLSRVDAVIEICDARLPESSRNPVLNAMLRGKARVLMMNKADLANPAMTRKWQAYYQAHGVQCAAITAGRSAREVFKAIENLTRDKVARGEARGVRRTVRVMVVGVPNVGKSTIINQLHGGAIAQVGNRPGVTRANQWVRVGEYLEVLDTPGLLWPKLDDPVAARAAGVYLRHPGRGGGYLRPLLRAAGGYDSPGARGADGAVQDYRYVPAWAGTAGGGVPRAWLFAARGRAGYRARQRRGAG